MNALIRQALHAAANPGVYDPTASTVVPGSLAYAGLAIVILGVFGGAAFLDGLQKDGSRAAKRLTALIIAIPIVGFLTLFSGMGIIVFNAVHGDPAKPSYETSLTSWAHSEYGIELTKEQAKKLTLGQGVSVTIKGVKEDVELKTKGQNVFLTVNSRLQPLK